MKKTLLAALGTATFALPSFAQDEEPDRVEDPVFMEYFDEAYSVYLDGSNRCAGIKDLTGPETEVLWTAPTWGPCTYDLSFADGEMTISKTLTSTHDNWASVDLQLTDWMGGNGERFTHIAEKAGRNVDTLTGMFVDMSIDGQVVMNLTVKTDTDCQLRVDLVDANGRQANGKAPSNYENSQKIDLSAADGWVDLELTWTDPLFDYYSGAYWGVTNGMRDNSDPLWVWKDYSKTEKREYKIEEQTAVPVSMQAICKIIMIIDDGGVTDPGMPSDVKTVQFKNMSLGKYEDAVPFKAVTGQNIANGNIVYSPANAVLVRAREDIDWGPSQYIAGDYNSPYQIADLPDFHFPTGFRTKTINLDNYFADDESELSFFVSTKYDNEPVEAYIKINYLYLKQAEYFDYDRYEYVPSTGSDIIYVTARDRGGNEITQDFLVSVSDHTNTTPYIINDLNDLQLTSYFGSYVINLDNYFADAESELTYSIETYNVYEENIYASVKSNTLTIEKNENASTAYAEIIITATDDGGEYTIGNFTIYAGNNNSRPDIIKEMPDIDLDKGFNLYSINLADYFSSNDGEVDYDYYANGEKSLDVAISGNHLILTEGAQVGIVDITVIAYYLESYNTYTEQHFSVNYGKAVPNHKPYVTNQVSTLVLETGFGSHTIDLSKAVVDKDGDQLTYSLFNNFNAFSDEKSPVAATVTNDKLYISEQSSGSSFIAVTAKDEKDSCILYLQVDVLAKGNKKPTITDKQTIVQLEQSGQIASIYLPDYLTDTDALTYYVYSSELSSLANPHIDEDYLYINTSSLPSGEITIIADDGKGGIEGIELMVLTKNENTVDPISVADIPDVFATLDQKEVTVDLAKYFSKGSGRENRYEILCSTFNYSTLYFFVDANNDILKILPNGLGSEELEVVAYNSSGGYASQKLTITIGDETTTSAPTATKNAVAVFPTVFSETVTIEGAHGTVATVSSMAGTVVFRSAIFGQSARIDLSSLAKGIYLLQVGGKTERIIKE